MTTAQSNNIVHWDSVEDRDLMRRVAKGDVLAFEAIYDRYSSQAFALALRVTGRRSAAEEVTQDAFLSLWRTARRYDPSRGTLRTLLFSVVRNRGIDWLRRGARHERSVELDEMLVARLESPERTDQQVVDRDQARQAREMLTSLPAEQRQVIELAFYHGLTHTEIAAKVGLPLGTVKGRQRLALRKMRDTLAPESGIARSACSHQRLGAPRPLSPSAG